MRGPKRKAAAVSFKPGSPRESWGSRATAAEFLDASGAQSVYMTSDLDESQVAMRARSTCSLVKGVGSWLSGGAPLVLGLRSEGPAFPNEGTLFKPAAAPICGVLINIICPNSSAVPRK